MTEIIEPIGAFDISPFTRAPMKLEALIEYQGKTPEQVFAVVGDPEKVKDYYVLAKAVKIHPPGDDGEIRFNVDFTFFGDVYEEVLVWQPPHRYVYLARGENFPIKDYIAMIEVFETAAADGTRPARGTMRWTQYYSEIEGEHFRRVLPLMLPPINDASMNRLAELIGGTRCVVKNM